MDKIFETNPSFDVKQRTMGKVQFLFFKSHLLVLTTFSFWEKDWANFEISLISLNFLKS